MITERFPQPPPQLDSQPALYDYLFRLTERLNLLLEDLPGEGEAAPAAAESPLTARQTRALLQRTVEGLTAADIHGGDLTCGDVTCEDVACASVTASGGVNAASVTASGTVTAASLTAGSVTSSGGVNAASLTASGAVSCGNLTCAGLTASGTVAVGGDTSLTLGNETLAAYVQRQIAAAISNEEENT